MSTVLSPYAPDFRRWSELTRSLYTVLSNCICRTVFGEHPTRRYPIPAPSLSEQKVIVAKLNELTEETQRLVRIYERKLAALEALKKSLLHQAFTGLL
ncbi:MAG: hypothetical protein NTU79_22310 [Planctomycetota bacterium]|nr:hypothetical protein [Planctomycetota bacterium]